MKHALLLLFVAFLSLSSAQALVSVGGYVPFGPSTQKETTGSKNTFSFDPMVSVNSIFPTPFYGQLFLPEFGLVFHGEGEDGYSKTTMLFLFDFGYEVMPSYLLRYGVGTVITRISGDGGTVQLLNGGSPDTYYQPNEASSSWNTTLNLGLEHSFMQNYALRFQTYWFSLLDAESRKGSYSINLIYYL